MILVADCNPILIYESKAQIFALIHAGRVGIQKSILTKTIQNILKKPQTKIENFLVFIGASIRKCCYEISKDLSESFPQKYILKNNSSHKLDMIAMLQDELLKNNIHPNQTQILPNCSCCQKELFSYRRDNITGRFALIAWLK
ncbi:hypothetical protein BKH44_03980 [Helicobacter sp. 13S00477-4]|nr:hypothetical protein BKH44_03980 [Helicobacter sp. 13S00477-4]